MSKLKINTYISNFIPEFGYSTKENKEYLPIDHPDAKVAAQKCLDYEDRIYLNGYIEIIFGNKIFLNDQERTDDLLFTWDDFARLIIQHNKEDEFDITLLDNGSTLKILNDGANYRFILNSVHSVKQNSTSILSIPSVELIEGIKTSFEAFVDFCNSGLVFNEESEYKNIMESNSKIKNL
ncbi:hypothetical protein [Pradoshia sp.]